MKQRCFIRVCLLKKRLNSIITLNCIGKVKESGDDGMVKFITGPQRKDEQAHTEAHNEAHQYIQETFAG